MRRSLLCVAIGSALLATACASLDNLTGGEDGTPPPPPSTSAPPAAGTTTASAPPAAAGSACDSTKPFVVSPLPTEPTTDDVFAARRDPAESWYVLSRRQAQALPQLLAGASIDAAKPDAFNDILLVTGTVEYPTLGPDANTLYFHVEESTSFSIHRATRNVPVGIYIDDGAAFSIADPSTVQRFPYVVPSGAALYYTDGNDGSTTIVRASLGSGAVETILAGASHPVVSPDELTMYFASHATPDSDVWVATRTSKSEPFGGARVVPVVSTPGVDEEPTWISRDGCTLLYQRALGDRRVIMQATR